MMKLRNLHESKKGVASLYAVIFATILFGVITLSFIRIILSESRQSIDDELSQSAYDSALAGVEDAKRAVNAYYACLNGGKTDCGDLFKGALTCDQFNNDQSILKQYMGFQDTKGEVKIQEQSTSMGKEGETSADQAYTCITLSDTVEDYRSTLSSDTRVRVVPLGVESEKLKDAKIVEFQWFSENNGTNVASDPDGNPYRLYKDKALKTQGAASKVPVISLTLLYTDASFNISSFNNSTGSNYGTMILLPGISGDGITNKISWNTVSKVGNSDAINKQPGISDNSTRNEPFLIQCHDSEFACSVDLQVDNNLPLGGNAFLIVSMPYGETISDFKVAMYKDENKQNPILFEGAQISVDSTGRANQLYRRVETRLDPVDSYFPYPQFAAELDGDDDSKLWKNFWITYNCWTQGGTCANNGTLTEE